MTVTTMIQHIEKTEVRTHQSHTDETGSHHEGFDVVEVIAGASSVSLFLPYGTGQAVADAINAAIANEVAK